MQPYVICQGDYLAKLAYQFDFDPDVVWNDPSNAALKQLRTNPNILFPSDVLYIPEQTDKPPATQALTTGSTNAFVANAPTVNVSVQFSDTRFASQAYTIQELPQLTGLTTDGTGLVTFAAPVTLDVATVSFDALGVTFACQIGHIDPIGTLSGIFQRLQNLGFLSMDETLDPSELDGVRAALRDFKTAQSDAPADSSPPSSSPPSSQPPSSASPPPPSSGPASGPASAPASDPSPPPDSNAPPSSPPSSAPASAPASGPASSSPPSGGPPSSSPPSSSPPSSAPPSSAPPSSGPPSSEDSSPPSSSGGSSEDNAGLADDGTLDDETSQLLLKVHGS